MSVVTQSEGDHVGLAERKKKQEKKIKMEILEKCHPANLVTVIRLL